MTAAPGYAGTIPADLSVDQNGGFQARIALAVPPGIAGAAPDLSFAYNSTAGNGLLGMGWSLTGLSVIERCGATIAQDGFCGGVGLDDDDRLTLDGARLVPPAGLDYFDPAATYQTEIQTWHRVVPSYSGVSGRQGPDSFEVTQASGRVLRYGTTSGSQGVISAASPTIRAWYLSEITDPTGNTITVTYQQAGQGGQLAPAAISYTANGQVAARRSVTFGYEPRDDAPVTFVAGYPVSTDLRLSSVTTAVDDGIVASYELAYEYGTPTGRSRLISLTRADGAATSLPATTMTWQDGTPGLGSAVALDTSQIAWGGTLLPMDVDGDGAVDFVNVFAAADDSLAMTVFLARPDGTLAPPVTTSYPGLLAGGQLVTLDANGDGRTEIVYATDQEDKLSLTLFVAEFGDGQWTMQPVDVGGAGPAGLLAGGQLLAGDIDGDGLADLVYATSSADGVLRATTLFSDGTTFSPSPSDATDLTVLAGGELIVMDVNADGRDDVLYATLGGDGQLVLTTLRSAGRDGFVQVDGVLAGSLEAGGQLIPADVNADGNTDAVYLTADPDSGELLVQVLLNDGQVFTPGPPARTGLDFGGLVTPAALTGGPVPELLACTPDPDQGLQLSAFALSAGGVSALAGFTAPAPGVLAGGNAMPLDLRGRGLSDLVYLMSDGDQQTGLVMNGTGTYPDLLLSITNGLGGQHLVQYAPMTDPAVYSASGDASAGLPAAGLVHAGISGASYGLGGRPAPASAGARDVLQRTPVPKYVVQTATKTDGLGGSWAVSYHYADALIDRSGRGWLGFAQFRTVDESAGLAGLAEVAQLFPLTQLVTRRTMSRADTGAVASVTEYGYAAVPFGASTVIQAIAADVANFAMDSLVTEPDTILRARQSYDGYGNVALVTMEGTALASPSAVVQEYHNDPVAWRIGLLTERSEYADGSRAVLLARERLDYDPVTALPVAQQRWDNVTGSWLSTTWSHDQFGNVTEVTDPAGNQRLVTFDAEYHSFPAVATVTPEPGSTLSATAAYDPAFGLLVSATDPAGNVSTQALDGLGRVTGQSRTSPAGVLTAVMTQSWTAAAGLLCQTTASRLDWTADSWAARSSYLDGLGRTVRTEQDSGDPTRPVLTTTTYNGAGQRLTHALPHFAGAAGAEQSWTYDPLGRPVAARTPAADGSSTLTTTVVYPRSDTSVTTVAAGTPQAQQVTVRYGLAGQGNVPVSRASLDQLPTVFRYDGRGRLLSLTDPLGITTSASYDTLGRQLSVEVGSGDSVLLSRSISYDDLKQQAAETTAAGQVTYTFDGIQRLVRQQSADGQVTTLVYDEAGQPNSAGRLTSVTLPSGDTIRYGYDPDGNLTQRSVTVQGEKYQFTDTFTPAGTRLARQFPDGSAQASVLGPAGLLTAIEFASPDGPPQALLRYGRFDPYGNPGTVSRLNGVASAFSFDPYGRVISQATVGQDGQRIFSETVTRERVDAVAAVTDDGLAPAGYAYDATGRLSAVSGSAGQEQLSYDLAGNLAQFGATTISNNGYAATSATGPGPFTADYDGGGALTSLTTATETVSYGYDAEQRLVTAGAARYDYDHQGRLRVGATPAVTTRYVTPEYEVAEFADGSRQHTCYLGHRGVREFAATTAEAGTPPVISGVPAPGELFLHSDYRRSTRAASGPDGLLAAAVDFDVFGNPAGPSPVLPFRYGFTGREYHAEAQAYYFGARYYSPVLRRFITPDDQLGGRLLDRDTANLYAYVLNDPATLTDWTGHSWWDFAGQVILDTAMIAGGIAVIALTGGAANIAGSTLIGAGVGGLAYDIRQAATGNGASVSWKNYGIAVGLGAATGLLTGGVAAGTGAALTVAGDAVTTFSKIAIMAGVMALTSSGTSVLSTLANNAISHQSLSAGLGMAAVTGAAFGLLGGAVSGGSIFGDLSGTYDGLGEDGANGLVGSARTLDSDLASSPRQSITETTLDNFEMDEAPSQPRANPAADSSPKPTLWSLMLPTTLEGAAKTQAIAYALLNVTPRLVFGTLRTAVSIPLTGDQREF